MNITKEKSKTILTIETSVKELRACLEAYQNDMIAEIVFFLKGRGKMANNKDIAAFATICLNKGKAFDELVEQSGTPWVDGPTDVVRHRWHDAVIDNPYIYGVTEDVITDDVEEVIIVIDGVRYNISTIIKFL
jgi:hypothetical protein